MQTATASAVISATAAAVPFQLDHAAQRALTEIAAALVDSVKVGLSDKVLIWHDSPRNYLVDAVAEQCARFGANVSFFERDLDRDAELVPRLEVPDIHQYFARERELIDAANKMIIIRSPRDETVISTLPDEHGQAYKKAYRQAHSARIDGTMPWILFYYPTEAEAQVEGLTYKEYFDIVLEGCNQPWGEIKAAQAILVEKLNRGNHLRFVINESDSNPEVRTNISMSIRGMTFCNSTILRNYPGSEVFSAPEKYSVNGQLYAPGVYVHEGERVKDLRFVVRAGRIVEAFAAEGQAGLDRILKSGPGARYFGEVAVSTNRGLRKRLINELYGEKPAGHIHLTPGQCYTMTHYDGVPVKVNNGNTKEWTSEHWDISVSMQQSSGGGKIILDGEVIQEDGIFLDPRLAILNPYPS